ncbi:MAG: TfoX/Sxy family protein [Lachnospiraceae bacterium]|nr:TfoX/Sxy family protein [Ruminococcus sp.]MCM1274706.1 TfoX/Sxy family protein [Lachnospiraceae bacterium]
MASKLEFVEYVAEQCGGAGTITYKKMFGEYGLYCNGKIFALVCGDEFFVKVTDEVRAKYPGLPEKPPYDGAKNYFLVENVDDRGFLAELVAATYEALPETKAKK